MDLFNERGPEIKNWNEPLMRCRQYNNGKGPEMECCNEIHNDPVSEIVCLCTEKNCNSQELIDRYKQAIESGKEHLIRSRL